MRESEATKAWKRKNFKLGETGLEILVAEDYTVVQFSNYHFRINDILDVWPSSRKWYDRRRQMRGEYKDLVAFVKPYINHENLKRNSIKGGDVPQAPTRH